MLARSSVLVTIACLPAGCLSTCGDNSLPGVDAAASDGGRDDDGGSDVDAAQPLTFVDFAVGGCAGLGSGCVGPSPLELQFTPIAGGAIDVYLWSFGDGEVSGQAGPSHVYRDPGSYTVSLDVEGPGGAIGVFKTDFVTVEPAPLAAPCERDEQCASGLCVCGEGDGSCPASLAGRGFCSADCAATPCADGVCVDLAPSDPGSPEDWQRELCLPDCSSDSCDGGRADLACRSLRRAGDTDWLRACFAADVLGDIGASCSDAGGNPDDARCSSGQCLPEGARGVCAYDCSTAECPAEAECASFSGSLGDQCLRVCDLAFDCSGDPWLACEPPGGAGAKGFTVAGAPAPGGYCAPGTCTMASDCGTEGQCTMGFCGP